MMTKFKFYLFSLLAVLSLATLTSCETDDDIGYGLSGAFGKSWYGDFGSYDYDYDEPLHSEVMFMSGRSDDYGSGWERTYYFDGYPCYEDHFDWEVSDGVLYLYYASGEERRIYDYYVGHDVFKGYWGDYPFKLYLDKRW